MSSFDAVVFPKELASISVKSRWMTQVVIMGSGSEQRAALWNDARRNYDAATAGFMSLADYLLIEKHFNGRRGRGRSFPLRDRTAYRATAEPFGVGDGATTQFQLSVASGDSGNAYGREIYLPETGTYSIFDNGLPVTEGAGAGKFTMGTGATGGLVTFGTAPVAAHIVTATFDYFIPVRYEVDQLPDYETIIWTTGTSGLVKGTSIPMLEAKYQDEF